MPSVKIPRKSTFVDMTPFVDVAFLILTFFIMATKFKPQEPIQVVTPNSVSVKELEEKDALLVTFDSSGRVFFGVNSKDDGPKKAVIEHMNTSRNLNLTRQEIVTFVKSGSIGVPFAGLKQFLSTPEDERQNIKQPGIPLDTLGGELYYWIRDAIGTFTNKKLDYLIKGDNAAKYPNFKMVLNAFKKNDIYKFKMITMMEDAPTGSELFKIRQREKAMGK